MNTPEIPIFFTIDNGYAPLLAAAIASAAGHASPDRRYRAIVLHEDLSEENAKKIMALQTTNFRITLTPMKANFEALDDRMSNRLRCDYFTLTIYYRLFIPAMFPEYDKGIYIDSDVVLNADIAELFDTDLQGNLIGACRDLSIADIPPLVAYTENAVGAGKGEYINSGVLLMDLKGLRNAHLEEHFLHLLTTYHFDSIAPDQDYLNAMCSGKILYLDEAWDAMPNPAHPELKNPKLIHYNLFAKPWCYDNVPYETYFWHWAKQCGFFDQIQAHKDAYDDEKKQSDSECLATLVKKGSEIPDQEVTFKKMSDKGVAIKL